MTLIACGANEANPPESSGGGPVTQGGAASLGGAGGSSAGAPASGGSAPLSGGATNAASGGAASLGRCAPPPDSAAPPEKLSQTGCMSASVPTAFADIAVPYEVNSPLWSDSADKARAMVVPAGKKVHVLNCAAEPALCPSGAADAGKWKFPVGTVLLKNFAFDGKLVETRLFVHHAETSWVGYGYAWNTAQTEATLVPAAGSQVSFDTGQRSVAWTYPSRDDCMLCHNPQTGFSLGPETAQLNRVVAGKNQIDRLQELGLFDVAPVAPYAAALVTPYVSQAGTPPASATVEARARSYLHANCAHCHRPDGDFGYQDLRFDVKFADMGICNAEPRKGYAGVAGSTILTPGNPALSVIHIRMQSLEDKVRMPQIATHQVDAAGLALIDEWIRSINACP